MNTVINKSDYTYELPSDRIALFPLKKRDQSKLLVYQKGEIGHRTFSELPDLLPKKSILFYNDTKVIPARILFEKPSGALIEVFLLDPIKPSTLMLAAMEAKGTSTWHCTIGNLKKWNEDLDLTKIIEGEMLTARLIDKNKGIVQFSWPQNQTFAEVIERMGITPLPPYLNRSPIHEDKITYQTVYSKSEGAVAAPTAGLHFTEAIFSRIKSAGIETQFLTLHVSAGTFQPVKSQNAADHKMHPEQMIVTLANVEALLSDKIIMCVGTTSVRTLESLYWWGLKLTHNGPCEFVIDQNDTLVYDHFSVDKSLCIKAIIEYMETNKLSSVSGSTSIYITPGYTFRVCEGLITNFHQPESTLILLVAAFIGKDWEKVYSEALSNNYRFLSYGDSSLLLR